jgi:hypothetical protein
MVKDGVGYSMDIVGFTQSITGENSARIYRIETNKLHHICRGFLSRKCATFSAFVASQSGAVPLRISLKGPHDKKTTDFSAGAAWVRMHLTIQSDIDLNPIDVFLEARSGFQLFVNIAIVFPQLEEALFPTSPIPPDMQLPAISKERSENPPRRDADVLYLDSSKVSFQLNTQAGTYIIVETPLWDTKDIYVDEFLPFMSFANISEKYEISVGVSGRHGSRLVIRESSSSSCEFFASNMIMGKTEYFLCCIFDNDTINVIVNGTLCLSKVLTSPKVFERFYIGSSEFYGRDSGYGTATNFMLVPYAFLYPRVLIEYVRQCPTHDHFAYEFMLKYFRYCLVEKNEIETFERLININSFSQFGSLLQNTLPLINGEFPPGKKFTEEAIQQLLWALLSGRPDIIVGRESFAKTGRTDILVSYRNEDNSTQDYRIEFKLWSARGYDEAPSQPLKYMLAPEAVGVFVMIDRRKSASIEDFEKIVENWPAAGFTDTELRCFNGTGGFKCREGSSAASLSLRL